MKNIKKIRLVVLPAIILGYLLFFNPILLTTKKCPLKTGSSYRVIAGTDAYYITKKCTKRIYRTPGIFLYGWKSVIQTDKKNLNKIPKDKNYFINSNRILTNYL